MAQSQPPTTPEERKAHGLRLMQEYNDAMTPQPLNDDFNSVLTGEDDQPGAPFYDKTLNFLQDRFDKTNSDIGNATQRKYKIEDQIATLEAELDTVRTLLLEEWRERKPFNPETGELIDAPFGEEE